MIISPFPQVCQEETFKSRIVKTKEEASGVMLTKEQIWKLPRNYHKSLGTLLVNVSEM